MKEALQQLIALWQGFSLWVAHKAPQENFTEAARVLVSHVWNNNTGGLVCHVVVPLDGRGRLFRVEIREATDKSIRDAV